MHRHAKTLLTVLLLLCPATSAFALHSHDRYLNLPSLPVSLWEQLESQAVVNATTGDIRFIARINNLHPDQLVRKSGKPWETLASELVVIQQFSGTLICHCAALGENEYLVSEQAIMDQQHVYVSINDESYKALLEMVHYPMDKVPLISVAVSELAYVYNAHALEDYLQARGFTLEAHGGMMNSVDYPGFRDTEYFVTSNGTHRYLSIRGTSGARDVETTLDAELVPFSSVGLVHRGYLEVARHVYSSTTELLQRSDRQLIVTGHSLGGSVALLVSMLLAEAGIPATNFNYAPVPAVDRRLANHFNGILQTTNYFLPNEELSELEREQWLRLSGRRKILPHVGKTAGAAHFVINYLKSMLVMLDMDRQSYEDALPDCVLEKYPCFGASKVNFVSACALVRDNCFNAQRDLLMGYPENNQPGADGLERMIRQTTRDLTDNRLSSHHERVLRYRLAYLLGETRSREVARQLIGTNRTATGFHGFIESRIGQKQRQ